MSEDGDDISFSLDAGISPARFSDRIRAATADLRQGTLVAVPPLVYAARAEDPLHAATVAWAETERAASGAVNVLNVTRRPEWGVIVTQTCDLVEEGARPKRPWVLIAPVYRLRCDRGVRRQIERERGFAYLCPVTGLDGEDDEMWVADLRLLVAAEKGWLVGAATRPGFADEAGHDRLARQLARLFSRPAFATPLVKKVLEPLNALLASITEEYEGADPIAEVALALGRSRLDPTNVQVFFLLEGQLDGDLREAIASWGRSIVEDPPAGMQMLMPRIVHLNDLNAGEYRTLVQVDVASFSPPEEEIVVLRGASAAAGGASTGH